MPRSGSTTVDLVGQIYGRLTVLCRAKNPYDTQAMWTCKCICGTVRRITSHRLRFGLTRSCGCLSIESARKRFTTHGQSSPNETTTFRAWSEMLKRCTNTSCKAWNNYGGRGITVCEQWRTFDAFFANMGEKPPGLELDRIDNNGNYEPSNCRWATRKEQARNKRTNRIIEYEGRAQCLAAWADEFNLSYSLLYGRLSRGWSIKRAITMPKRNGKKPHTASP